MEASATPLTVPPPESAPATMNCGGAVSAPPGESGAGGARCAAGGCGTAEHRAANNASPSGIRVRRTNKSPAALRRGPLSPASEDGRIVWAPRRVIEPPFIPSLRDIIASLAPLPGNRVLAEVVQGG